MVEYEILYFYYFDGDKFLVNCPQSELKCEVLDEKGDVISPFSLDKCVSVSSDKTLIQLKWQDVGNVKDIAGKTVLFRFHMKYGSLYAFRVSPNK
jgi:hypothetical protein